MLEDGLLAADQPGFYVVLEIRAAEQGWVNRLA